MSENKQTYPVKLKAKWQYRFNFFDEYGVMPTEEYHQAYKKLPWLDRMKVGVNIYAALFGFIYFCILGMWRKGLVLLIAHLIFIISLSFILDMTDISYQTMDKLMILVNLWFIYYYSHLANQSYYLHIKKGSRSWNPLEHYSPEKRQ